MSSVSGVGNLFVQAPKNDPAVQQNSAQIVILPPVATAITSPYNPRINYTVAHGENLPVSSQFSRQDVAARLLNPALDLLDSLMLFSYYSDPTCSATTQVTAQDLRQKYFSLLNEQMLTYDGKVSLSRSKLAMRIGAFEYALEALDVMHGADLSICNQVYSTYVFEEDLNLLSEYRNSPSDALRDKILKMIDDYDRRFQRAAVGSPEKIAAGRALTSFVALAEVSGITGSEIFMVKTGLAAFNIPSEDIDLLYSAEVAAKTPEPGDNAELLPKIEARLSIAYEKLYSALAAGWIDVVEFDLLISMASSYADTANKLGAKYERIMEIKEAAKKKVFGATKVVLGSRADFSRIGDIAAKAPTRPSGKSMAYVASPENLPSDIRWLLSDVKRDKSTSYFDLIKDNLDYVVFSCDTRSATEKLFDEDTGGYAFPFTNIVQIDLPNIERGEKRRNIFLYFELIVHEAQHQYNNWWLSENKYIYQSTVDEAIAYYEGAHALKLALKSRVVSSYTLESDRKEAKTRSEESFEMFSGALQIMGLSPVEDPGPYEQMFTKIDFDMDLSTYPDKAPLLEAEVYVNKLINAGLLTSKDKSLFPALRSGIQKLISGVPFEGLDPAEREALGILFAKANSSWTMETSSLSSLRESALKWNFLPANLNEFYNSCNYSSSTDCLLIASGRAAESSASPFIPVGDSNPLDLKVLNYVIGSHSAAKFAPRR